MAFVITESCVDVMDRACVDQCPVDCIYDAGQMMVIHPDECINCGACEPVCPQEAIFNESLVPPTSTEYIAINRNSAERIAHQLSGPGER